MLLGPVFQTEMVTSARRGRYFLLRVLFAAALLLCLWSCYEGVSGWNNGSGQLSIRDAAELASGFFQAFAWLTMITAMMVTPAIAAGAIATERERRTIEYLFATDLSNSEIVLSKLAGKLLLVGKLLFVALPVLAIFRLMGGIPGSTLVMYFIGLASTVTLLTVGAVCISVWTPRARDAIIRVYLVEALVFLLPLLCGMWLFALFGNGTSGWMSQVLTYVMEATMSINPLQMMAAQMMGGVGMPGATSSVWRMVACQSALSVALAILSVVAVRRVHLRALSGGEKLKSRWSWQFPQYRAPLGDRPMLWKELFARTATTKLGILGRISIAILVAAMIGISLYVYFMAIGMGPGHWQSPAESYLQFTATITAMWGSGVLLIMGVRAAGLVAFEKERDCWLSLISTPLSGSEIITAKILGNFYAFRWLLAPLLFVWGLQLTLMPLFLIAIPLHLLALGVGGLFATAVGLAYSLRLSTSLKAIGATMGTLFFVCGGYILCCCVPLAISGGDDEIFKIAMVGFVPFHLMVPGYLVSEDFPTGEEWIVVDFILGTLGYGTVACILVGTLISRFDEFAGRSGLTEFSPRAVRTTPGATPVDPFNPPAQSAN